MSNSDPNLQKLVEGAQKHVKSPGSTSSRDEAMLRALNEYETWREANLAEAAPQTPPVPAKAKKTARVVRDPRGRVIGLEMAD